MRRIPSSVIFAPAAAAILALLTPCLTSAQASGSPAKPPKPDLHAGGLSPSTIPNDATTVVTLPGFHLTGAHLTTDHLCKVVSFKVVSDNEIQMSLKGTRTVEDKDEQCGIEVRTPGGTASTSLVVELTDAQQQKQVAAGKSEGISKANALVNRTGKRWRLAFASGSTETYTSAGATQDGMPTFQNDAGSTAKIAVSNDNTVMIVEPGCMRSGKVVGDHVKDGQSQGECKPSGAWTATVEH